VGERRNPDDQPGFTGATGRGGRGPRHGNSELLADKLHFAIDKRELERANDRQTGR
jgi:hypothetical protein